MNALRTAKAMVLAVLTVALGGFLAGSASGAASIEIRAGRTPYRYSVWEEVTRYRYVRRPVTKTFYRTERQLVTTYETVRRRELVHCRGPHGRWISKYIWREVRVPRRTWRAVDVPYEKTVIELVREPYTVRVLVERIGHRPARSVAIAVSTPHLSISWGRTSRPHYPKDRVVTTTKYKVQSPGLRRPTVHKTRTTRTTTFLPGHRTKDVVRTKHTVKTKGVPKRVTRTKQVTRRK